MQKQIELDEAATADSAATSDPLLHKFLNADAAPAAEEALRILIQDEAMPVILRVVVRKSVSDFRAEDIVSAAREQLLGQLLALRSGERSTPILQFQNYVAGVAYSAWAEHLRDEKPRFSMLLNRLRYLLENRTRRGGFSIWDGKTGTKWCGLARLEQAEPQSSLRLQLLIVDPRAAARDIFGRRDWQGLDLATLTEKIFTWLECPIELRDLVTVIAELLQMSDRAEALDADERNIDNRWTAATKSPEEEATWNEYLRWLWKEIGKLSPRQCASFLLNSNVLRDFELLGVASIRSLAPRFAMAPEHLVKLWQRLPLDDNAIAEELGCTRQQVINLRRVARDNLGRAWQEFRANTNAVGNKIPHSTSSKVEP